MRSPVFLPAQVNVLPVRLCVLIVIGIDGIVEMALLGMQDVSVGYGGGPLLERMNFQVESGERICLLGRNGVGKSTLMKLIGGELEAESGVVSRSPGLSVTCLTQVVPAGLKGTVFDVVSEGLGSRGKLLAEYHLLSHRVATEAHNENLLGPLDKLQHRLDLEGGWQLNHYVETIIEKIKLDADAEVATLSAGMKRRVLLARAIVREPDILLLDEPTNHLDIEAITWLEEFLGQYTGTLMFVSHDRAFVKKLSTRIIELDRGRLTSYQCDYETYLRRKESALAVESVENDLFDKKLAQEEVWIRKGIKARRRRNEGRVRALVKMREERSQRKELVGTVRMQMQDAQLSGKLVIEAKGISFGYKPDEPIIREFSTLIMRGDKIGVIGPNGSGKTTLLRVLLKELEAQAGTVRQGTNLEVAYFDQSHAQLDYEKSVYENIADGSETISINGSPRHIIGYLQDFLFTPRQSRNSVGNLSGGERNRLLLARLFARPSNVLVLDEPTNDLDIETLDLLEEFLLNYSGTVLLVSHDREFLNNVVTSTLVMEGKGTVKEYVGGYDDWLRQSEKANQLQEPPVKVPAKKAVTKRKSERGRKLSFKETKELEAIPKMIETLETEQQQLHEAMAEPDFYKKGSEIAAVTARLSELREQLENAYARWQKLEELQE
ncbi:MAG: ATP-binding cassette domain-containing protein [Sedimentisphaerales bacterium]|nr:ATP-binding cassette domain-containing protein [Sedimentisphaerales bacterium]